MAAPSPSLRSAAVSAAAVSASPSGGRIITVGCRPLGRRRVVCKGDRVVFHDASYTRISPAPSRPVEPSENGFWLSGSVRAARAREKPATRTVREILAGVGTRFNWTAKTMSTPNPQNRHFFSPQSRHGSEGLSPESGARVECPGGEALDCERALDLRAGELQGRASDFGRDRSGSRGMRGEIFLISAVLSSPAGPHRQAGPTPRGG